MPAYALFDNVEVTDAEALAAYAAGVAEVVDRYGGRYLSVGGKVDTVEGEPIVGYPVLIEFPDLATAHRWYDSPDYRDWKKLRHSASRANAVFFGTDD
ncbi:DUF1330 domain-containing protein [Streptomyces sp. A7024]|uniref:DUF1330 domain-containing protein n=1 Tax=Streptomyces coryli TaxID=1128680 RepID=A0A6G4U2L0_9ACTN|nr:DUF1330 domain-containing protein [Streptomyces coryli]NGN65946.1 DUF1330 domain-containing protein [Streptomyces coryli]